jgi:hypothetical protein
MFIVDSEPELDRRYADLTIILRPEYRPYQLFHLLIEFKYIELGQIGLTAAEVRAKNEYELTAPPAVQEALRTACGALAAYRDALRAKYGNMLKLRVYAIVSLAFERILWEEIT